MKVKLIAHTPYPERVVAAAARCCYSNDDPDALLDGMTDEKAAAFLQKLRNLGHASPIEHATFTFSISGVSRTFLAQESRHRLQSESVRSQRYCKMKPEDIVVPPSIANNAEALALFIENYQKSFETYNKLCDQVKKEDARFALTEGVATAMVVTMNARALLNFFSLRCCARAQWEIRKVANEMLRLVKDVAPNLFAQAGASCDQLGYCPEGKMCCGKAPTLDMLLEAYEEKKERTKVQ